MDEVAGLPVCTMDQSPVAARKNMSTVMLVWQRHIMQAVRVVWLWQQECQPVLLYYDMSGTPVGLILSCFVALTVLVYMMCRVYQYG